jgi:signal transduction histidine kinase
MWFPRIVAAQRLQTWLLIAALVSVALIALLVVDLTRNLRTVVISETQRSLANATKELAQSKGAAAAAGRDALDRELKRISYEVLRSYPDVEGGYMLDHEPVGHSFPTYTEPGSTLRQPVLEHQEVLAAIAESRRTRAVASRVTPDHNDLVVVAALAGPEGGVSAWSLRRILNFSDSSELNKRLLLLGVMAVAAASIGFVLRLSFSMQRGFGMIQAGLERLRTDVHYRLPDHNSELSSIVSSINTMAESRQRLEEELRREDRLRVMGRVVAGIAHEIRNPLNGIRLTIRLLARRLQNEPSAGEPIAMITREIDRLDALLKSLLVFRPEEPQRIRDQPLQPILERTLALIKPHAREHGVTVLVTADSQVSAPVDGDRLQQALMNVLLNAIDASSENGTVEVALRRDNGRAVIDIEDSGPGLSPEQRERIFEAFYTTKPGGTGLGLAVTRALVEQMGGMIESGNGARGARFRVILAAGKMVMA